MSTNQEVKLYSYEELQTMPEDAEVKQYSYEDVKRILCEGCEKNIDETYSMEHNMWVHHIAGTEFKCCANEWRISSMWWEHLNHASNT